MSELIERFEGRVLPPRQSPLQKIGNILEKYIPGFIDTGDELDGIRQNSTHFIAGRTDKIPGVDPLLVHARVFDDVPTIDEAATVRVVSGTCMLGEYGINSFDAAGNQVHFPRYGIGPRAKMGIIAEVELNDTQIYTQETIARLGRVSIALQAQAIEAGAEVSAFWHISTPEYKLHAELMYNMGLFDKDVLAKYFGILETHADEQIQTIEELYESFGLAPPEMGSPLDGLFDEVEPGDIFPKDNELSRGALLELNDLISVSFFGSYIQASNQVQLPIYVDNISEQQIFEKLKGRPGFKGIGIYPLPVAVRRDNRDLYYHGSTTEHDREIAVLPWLES